VCLSVGAFSPKSTDSIVYMFTLTFNSAYAETASTMLESIEFDPDVIQ